MPAENAQKVLQYVRSKPGRKARAIAKELSLDRKEVNAALHAHSGDLVRQDDEYCWWPASNGELHVELPRACTINRFVGTLTSCGGFQDGNRRIELEVPAKCFMPVSGMALLTAWGLQQRAKGVELDITGDVGTRAYLSRMDVFEVLGVSFTEKFDRLPEAGRFIPVKLIEDYDGCSAAVNAVCDLVIHQFDDARQFLPALEWAVNEITDNILIHSESATPGVVCAQFYPQRKRLEVGICDMGRGLRASLGEAMTLDSDEEAIHQATKRGVTRDSTVGQGNGLAGSLDIAKVNGGAFEICTGAVTCRFTADGLAKVTAHEHMPGTGVALSLKTDRPVDLGETFIGAPNFTFLEGEAIRITEAGGIRVREECAHTGARPPAKYLRRKILSLLPDLEGVLVLDFDGVSSASSSFLDELLGRLAGELGAAGFHELIQVRNMTEHLRAMANVVIEQRMSTDTEEGMSLKVE